MTTASTSGRTVKYGETINLRLEFSESMDVENITSVDVSVTDEDGTSLDTGSATLWAGSILDSASSVHATVVYLDSAADDLYPGDRILIGTDGEKKEVREVVDYNSTTFAVTLDKELDYAHVESSPVLPMWCTYELDISDTAKFPNLTELWIRWNTDTADPEIVESIVIGKTAFAELDFWDEFHAVYPVEYDRVKSRDLDKFMAITKRRFKFDMEASGFFIDKVQNPEMLHDGLLCRTRYLILESGGESDTAEYDRAKSAWLDWLDKISHSQIWQDTDDDKIADEEEISMPGAFVERARYM